ncbi:MAG: hypothetical protein QM744_18435 [Mesorhizobium sp.]
MKRLALTLLALIVTGLPAIFIAGALSDYGYLGSCFEGACGYAAVFYAFPVIWIALFVIVTLIWKATQKSARS